MRGKKRTHMHTHTHYNNLFRWGDAPVQTIAAALFLRKEEIHFFNEIGYTHSIATHCPYDEQLLRSCSCDVTSNYGNMHPFYYYNFNLCINNMCTYRSVSRQLLKEVT